jgi:hypothetical protein
MQTNNCKYAMKLEKHTSSMIKHLFLEFIIPLNKQKYYNNSL